MGDNDGGPAFPTDGLARHERGMSLRDWYKGQALKSIAYLAVNIHNFSMSDDDARRLAETCGKLANAALAEREMLR